MTVREAAARLQLSPTSLYVLLRQGRLPHRRLGPGGRKIAIDEAEVERYWRACETRGGEVPRGELRHIKL